MIDRQSVALAVDARWNNIMRADIISTCETLLKMTDTLALFKHYVHERQQFIDAMYKRYNCNADIAKICFHALTMNST